MVRVCNTVAFSGCSLSKEDWGYGCFLISCKSGSTMKEIPYKLCGTGNLLQWLEFPKSWRELGQSGSIKKEKVDDYRKVTNWMSWRNEGEQVEKLADKAPKWTVKRIWENIYGKLLILCGCCLWGPANSCLIMVKDDHWSAELASGRRSGCRADKHKDQLGAIMHVCVWSSSNHYHPCLYFRLSVSAFLSFAEDSVSHCPSRETVSAFPNSSWTDLMHIVWITHTLPALFTQIFAFWSKRENLTAEILI